MNKREKMANKMYLCQECGKEFKGSEIRVDEAGYEFCPECEEAFVVGIDTVERERRAKAAKKAAKKKH